MLPAISICLTAISSVGYIAHLLRKAPEAWEDESGFHYEEQPLVRRVSKNQAHPTTGSAIFRPAFQHASGGTIR